VIGAEDGADVGTLLVGMDVGADTKTALPITTAASLIDDIDAFASAVCMSATPNSSAALSNCLENDPDETADVTWLEIEAVSSSALEKPPPAPPSKLLFIEKDKENGCRGLILGALVGLLTFCKEGEGVGTREGETVGFVVVGDKVGGKLGPTTEDGAMVGRGGAMGDSVGISVGSRVGASVVMSFGLIG
jgi:hypothetical protein